MKTNLLTLAALIMLPFSIEAQKVEPYSVTIIRGQNTGLLELFDQNTQTGWFPGWNTGDYPVIAKVKFNQSVKINKIKVFDWVGQTNFVLVNGQDTITRLRLNQWNKWQTKTFKSIETSELTIMLEDIQGDIPITELEFYYDVQPYNPPKQRSNLATTIGTNGFHWIPTDLIPCPNIRIYQMTQWTWTPKGLTVNPTVQADGMYDEYYQELKDKHITAIPCINKVPNWSHESKTDNEWADLKMNDKGTDPSKPESYKSIAEYGYQLAARYGTVKHPTSNLKVNPDQRWNGDIVNIAVSGLNLLSYIELENEPDRPWKDTLHKYTPQEFAAFMSAVYDGHEGRMGKGYGIKQADPNMKVVMAGLSSINNDYMNQMQVWFTNNRTDKQFAADVLNVHHYCNSSNQFPDPTVNLYQGQGINPWDDNFDYRIQRSTKEIWLSEFGYDTEKCSTVLCQSVENDSIQAEWILQTYLICIKNGIDKMFVYNLMDEPSADKGYVFGSSGLLKNDLTPKQSYYKVKWLVELLDGKKYLYTMKDNNVMVFSGGLMLQTKPTVKIVKKKDVKRFK